MLIKLPAALHGDGRAARAFNRIVSGLVRGTPLRVWLARRALGPFPTGTRRVLFVCKGNICRSTYAEAVAHQTVAARAGWSFRSAGLAATPGTAPPEAAIRVARARGVELSAHRSRSLAAFDPVDVDIVFVMEPVQTLHPALAPFRARAPIRLLGMAAGEPLIADPYGRDDTAFRETFTKIDEVMALLWGGGTRI